MRHKVVRKRWVILKNENEIFCGISRKYFFCSLDNLGSACIKTYMSKNQAINSFNKCNIDGLYDGVVYKAHEVLESIQISGL